MTCRACGSKRLATFNGEIALHFPGLKGLNEPIVWLFPRVLVCFDCGVAQFPVEDPELSILQKRCASTAS
jgi:hypothetical protein